MNRFLILVMTIAVILSCSSTPEKEQNDLVKSGTLRVEAKDDGASASKEKAPEGVASARLVRPEEARTWPHLRRHVGQLLLMNRSLQVLIPVAPPLTQKLQFFSVMTKAYRLEGEQWIALPNLPPIEIHLESTPGEPLQLIGQDITKENGDEKETVVAFFRQNKAGAEDARLVYALHPDQARLDIRLLSQNTNLRYRLRVQKGLSEDRPIPYQDDRVLGLTSSLLPDAISVLGLKPYRYKQDESFHEFEAGPGNPGFSLLLARDALIHQTELVQVLSTCYESEDKDSLCSQKISALRSKPKTGFKIEAPRLKKNETAIWQSALIYTKAGSFRSLIPIREGESLTVPLSFLSGQKWDVLTADSEGVLQKVLSLDKPDLVIKLPKLKKGSLVIRSDKPSPRYVEIKAAAEKGGKSLSSWLTGNQPVSTFVNPHTLLQSRWPFSMNLPTGDYRVRIFDGFRIQCEQRITILQNRKNTIDCNVPALVPPFSVRASISTDRAAIPEPLLKASGVTVITSSEKTSSKSLKEIPVLAAYDSELGLSIRAFPASKELEAGWSGLVKNNPERSTLLFFADYVRSHAKDQGVSIVLDCPTPGFQLTEYQWIAQSVKPDVLEVFGCGEPETAGALLETAQKLQEKQNAPVRLAAATFYGSLFGARVPAIYLPRYKHFYVTQKTTDMDPKLILDDLKSGEYTLGFRTELNFVKPKRGDKKLSLRLKTSDPVPRKVIVRVLDQSDRLSEIEVTQNLRQDTIEVPFLVKASTKFVRIEVLGREQTDDPLFALATSNFFRLDDQNF